MSAADAVLRLVQAKQAERRLPSVSAAVFRGGERLAYAAAGHANLATNEAPTPGTQYRLGSITKTFTAVLVMQLRDAGALDLDDRIGVHLPDVAKPDPTIRRLLAHLSGLQREPVGDVWESLKVPTREELFGNVAEAEYVSTPHRRWHYSNLAYALLGELVARLTGGTWYEAFSSRIATPLGLTRTTPDPVAPAAQGYFVHPYADRAAEEPVLELDGVASAAQLWSSIDDLSRWGAFLLDPSPDVLAASTLDEMASLHGVADEAAWTFGWGIGLMLVRRPDRILVGHTGGMPGHIAGLFVSRKDGIGAAAFVNNSSNFEPGAFCAELIESWLENDPPAPTPWVPSVPVPEEYESVLGRWWTEGSEFVFAWRSGRLEALPSGAPPTAVPAVFEPDGDGFRTVSGREAGERLRLVRDGRGVVTKMYWATYPLTREPLVFGASG